MTQSKVFDISTEVGTKAAERFKAHLEDSGYRVTTVPAGLDSVRITGETLLPPEPTSGDLDEVFPSNCWDENGMFHLPGTCFCDEDNLCDSCNERQVARDAFQKTLRIRDILVERYVDTSAEGELNALDSAIQILDKALEFDGRTK